MKKSIVLLITLLFISAISLLVFKNLSSGEIYLSSVNKEHNNTQVILLIKNAQEELLSYFSKDERYDSFISKKEELSLPFHIKGIDFSLTLSKYNKEININDFSLSDKKKKKLFLQKIEIIFNENNGEINIFKDVVNSYFLRYKITKENPIINSKQVNNIMSDYLQKTYRKEANELIEKIGFLPITFRESEKKQNNNIQYILCTLDFKINKQEYRSHFILDIEKKTNNTGVIDFAFTFK
ncbi:MAG: hypothetical protein HRT41_08925 [Campylobacteraceae bacterium]|nr:hypothetical protein [Campylobacteraceae bacterium]